MISTRRLSLATALLLAGASPALAAAPEKLSIIANGEVVGSVVGTTEGNRVEVDYRVDDNGRGPKHHEEIVLAPNKMPVEWTITGTSLMGGPVQEHYKWAAGHATWVSQADKGDVAVASPKLYIVNDDSPWAQGVYARAVLAAKSGGLDVLPGGHIALVKLRDVTIAGQPLTVYRLDGVQLSPSYLVLDREQRLFATLGGGTGVAIRTGFEKEAPTLLKLGADLARERVRAISARVEHRFDMPVRIRNVHVFDPRSGTLGPLSTVVTMRDRIAAILPGDGGPVPADEVLIEGDGGTVYPGLHDMHSHTTMESGLFYLAAGVTETRDMGNKNSFLLDLLPRVESGEVAGPHIVRNGFLEGRSPYSARTGIVVDSLPDALKAVRWYADHGYYELKIYNSFNPDWVKAAAAEAHRLGMGVTGHVPAFDSPDRVIEDGYDTIAHINQLMLGWLIGPKEDTRTPLRLTAMERAADLDLDSPRVQKTVALMKAHRTALDTTSVILERLMLSRAGTVQAGDADYLDHVPIGYQRYRKRTFVPLKDAAEDARYRKAFQKLLDTMTMLHKAGIQMLPGTDDPTGFPLQRELELYTMAGMTPAEVLRADTLDAATYLGQEHERGTIERGKKAELVLVAGDPTKDIRVVKHARMVMRGGAVYFPSEIYQALSIKPFATPPKMTVPAKSEGDNDDSGATAWFDASGHGDGLPE
jgi:imidazolonepropionase-like amidohydrolase